MTPQRHTLVVEPHAAGRRLDAWAAASLPEISRSRVQVLIDEGRVEVDGARGRASQKLRAGQIVHVTVPEPVPAVPLPEALPIRIVYEDADLLVVDKPAGMVVHPGAGRISGTLVNALLHHVRDLSGVGGVLRPGIVHRLDQGTSGLLVVAKNDHAHAAIARQFAARTVVKEYLAVVWGAPFPRRATIEDPIGRDPHHRKRMTTRAPRARAALSLYDTVEAFEDAALVRVTIRTGRTHQIRVHMASRGWPLVGDSVYRDLAPRRPARRGAHPILRSFARPALHAAHLELSHPRSGSALVFDSPLPGDIEELLATLRQRCATTRGPRDPA